MAVNQLGQPQVPSPLAFLGKQVNDPAQAYQDWNVLGQFLSTNIATLGTDPFANGAFGDGVHDDTKALQQTLNNSGGILYLRPFKTFLISSTLTVPGTPNPIIIYGGGTIKSSVSPIITLASPNANFLIADITFIGPTNGTCINSTVTSNFCQINRCSFATPGGGGTGIAVTNITSLGITGCLFAATLTVTGIALTTSTDVMITACEFLSGATVTTSGTCTYTLRNCAASVLDVYPSAVTATTATAGGGQAVPATVKIYIEANVVIAGVLTTVKIPAFSV